MVHEALVVHPSAHLPLRLIHFKLAVPRVAVDDEPCIAFLGIGEAQVHASLRGRELRLYTIVEGHTIVIW